MTIDSRKFVIFVLVVGTTLSIGFWWVSQLAAEFAISETDKSGYDVDLYVLIVARHMALFFYASGWIFLFMNKNKAALVLGTVPIFLMFAVVVAAIF